MSWSSDQTYFFIITKNITFTNNDEDDPAIIDCIVPTLQPGSRRKETTSKGKEGNHLQGKGRCAHYSQLSGVSLFEWEHESLLLKVA